MSRLPVFTPKYGVVLSLAGVATLASAASAQVQEFRTIGSSSNAKFGRALATVGDVDLDGVEDFLVAEPFADVYDGAVHLLSGATFAELRSHAGAFTLGSQFGTAVAAIGDVDLDGVPDYATTAPNWSISSRKYFVGRVQAWSGASGALLWTLDGTVRNERLGMQVVGIHDYDADGRPDLLVRSATHAKLVSGLGTFLANLNTFGMSPGTITRAGDLDGDGVDELLVGDPDHDGTYVDDGLVRVFSGATGAKITDFAGAAASDRLGTCMAAIGDGDGDGVHEFLVSGRCDLVNGSGVIDGMVEVRSGATLAVLTTVFGGPYDYLGLQLGAVGDWDGDGIGDWAAGLRCWGYPEIGAVEIHSGASSALIHRIDGEYDYAGQVHAHGFGGAFCAGDWNLDGAPDLAIGAFDWHDSNFRFEGAAYVYFGCPAIAASYGAGWPGTFGIPALTSTDPIVGAPITISATNSLGASTLGLLLVGPVNATVVLRSGATLLVGTPAFVPVALPPAGLVLNDALPDDPALYFTHLYLQVIEADAVAIGGLSFSAGLDLRCGFDL